MKYIGLLDCNNFFVSCEQLFRPDLRNVPTVVLSSNDGCVVARSQEVKDMGVPMGIPYFKVKADLANANAAVFSSNFPLYRDISRRVMQILETEVGHVEQYSVDEAFFALDVHPDEVATSLMHIQRAVERHVGVPISVGAAKTKTIAKYASEVGKRGSGVACIHGSIWRDATQSLPVHEIWGIGRQTSSKMKANGIETVADLCSADPSRVDALFGIAGVRMREELLERPVYGIGDKRSPQKSIMSTRSFKRETTSRSVVEDALAYHVAHAAEELRAFGKRAQYISVIVGTNRHGDWFMRGGSHEALLPYPSSDTRVLLREALRLFDVLYEAGVPYKKAGVVLGMFTDRDVEQMDLFGTTLHDERGTAIMQTIDALNTRFGSETITIGRRNAGEEWKASKTHASPSYTTNWREIPDVFV